MATYGKIGDKVWHKRTSIKGTICNNRIDSDNTVVIKTFDKRIVKWLLQNIVLQQPESKNSWKFESTIPVDIDWNLIAKDLTNTKPLLHIKRILSSSSEEHYILVHKSLIFKAGCLRVKIPNNALDLVTENGKAFKLKGNISEWVDWAKEIKKAKWPKGFVNKSTIYVQPLSIKEK